jgi:hypothetical protein
MSSDAPSDRPAGDRPTEPFARGRIQWSRPPQPVFHVGPLPRAEAAPQRPSRPAAGILTGSMIPPARREPEPEPEVAPVEAEPVAAAEPVVEPEPEHVAAPTSGETVIEPEAPEPVVTVPPPLSTEAEPAAEARSLPSVVVTPAIYAQVGAAFQKAAARSDKTWLAVAGIGALVVIGGFIWLATLPAPSQVDDGPPLLAAPEAALETPAEVEAPTAPAPVARSPQPQAQTQAQPAAPASRATARPAPRAAAPTVAEAPPEPAPLVIETAPLAVEPPTPATLPPSNPDAPIATRPTPLE